jgi:N utilization substance protein B
MLNRRHLRVKALHFLYAAFQSGKFEFAKGEKELLGGIEKVYDLYLYFLSLVQEVTEQALQEIEMSKVKHLPTQSDLNPNMRFVENQIGKLLSTNLELAKKCNNKKIAWNEEPEMIKKFFFLIKNDERYKAYMAEDAPTGFEEDKKIWLYIVRELMFDFEPFQFYFEEKSIIWIDDFQVVYNATIKTIEDFKETDNENKFLPSLYKDEEDDRKFVLELYRKTLLNDKENEEVISKMTDNWDVERIAMMDVLLMKMAITEATTFSNIPVKVTLNEYIELSKNYSSPKSKVFINGILDKIFELYKTEGKIKKAGRGLIE